MAGQKVETKLRVVDRFPRIFQRDEDFLKSFIKEKIKEGLRDGMKDLMKEAFDELLGDKKVKEIQEERKQAEIEKQRQEEMRIFDEQLKAEVEYNKHNPQITAKEASEILGISKASVYNLARQGAIPGEKSSFSGWSFRKNEVTAFKMCLSVKPRPRRCASKTFYEANADSSDPYLTPDELEKTGISPFSSTTLLKYVKRGLIEHKVVYLGKTLRRIYYIRLNHLKSLLSNPPVWLREGLKRSRGITG